MHTLQEIEARLAEIQAEIETRGAVLSVEQLNTFDTEVTALKEERAALIAANEQRQGLLASIAEGQTGVARRAFPSPAAPQSLGSEARESEDPYGTMEYRRAFMAHVLRGADIPAEYRADQVTHTTDIGAVIPTTVLNRIIEKIESVGMILPLVTRTAYKGGIGIPTSSAKPVATWVAEGKGSAKQKKGVPKDGMITFAYHKLRCAVATTLEVETMALPVFESTLISNVVRAMIKEVERAIISGDGAGKPKGILAETVEAGQEVESIAPSYSDLIDAEAALPIAYESGAVWCMSKKTFMQYFGLTDTEGQPIGRVNYGIAGKPERFLLGRPVVVCDYVDSFAATLPEGTPFAFLFNFSDYMLNTNYEMGVKKYEDNDTDDTVTKAIMLVDGKVIENGSLVVITKAA